MQLEELPKDWESVPCDLCGSWQADEFLPIRSYGSDGDALHTLVKCSNCTLVFLSPRPSPTIIGRYYPSDYYAYAGLKNRRHTLKQRLRSRLLDGLGGYDRSTLGGRLIHALVPRGVVDIIIPIQQRGKLLDVGCGDGDRVEWYRQRGFEAHGIDVSSRAIEQATSEGLDVRQGTLPEADYPDRFFDVVVMAHVLEHTHSPRTYLQEAFRILKPGGKLAVAVPNIDSHSAKVFKAYWAWLMPPLHLYHFSVDTLSRILTDSGFEIEGFVGKAVYPSVVKQSVKTTRARAGLWPSVIAWSRSGYMASGVQQLRCGPRTSDAITAYCSKPAALPSKASWARTE